MTVRIDGSRSFSLICHCGHAAQNDPTRYAAFAQDGQLFDIYGAHIDAAYVQRKYMEAFGVDDRAFKTAPPPLGMTSDQRPPTVTSSTLKLEQSASRSATAADHQLSVTCD